MTEKKMTVISASVYPNRVYLVGDGANPNLLGITVTPDTSPPIAPPSGAEGSYSAPPYADVRAGSTTWSNLLTRLGFIPFQAILVHTGTVVTDLNFANAPAMRREGAEDAVFTIRDDVHELVGLFEEFLRGRGHPQEPHQGEHPSVTAPRIHAEDRALWSSNNR